LCICVLVLAPLPESEVNIQHTRKHNVGAGTLVDEHANTVPVVCHKRCLEGSTFI
jgi:hypothetical protein